MLNESPVMLEGRSLTLEEVEAVARRQRAVTVSPEVPAWLTLARVLVEAALAHHQPVYGVNTGFGALADIRIAEADLVAAKEGLSLVNERNRRQTTFSSSIGISH